MRKIDCLSKILIKRCFTVLKTGMAPTLKLPKSKVELHIHLDGSLRIGTIIELAKKKQISLPSYHINSLKPFVSVNLEESQPPSLTAFLKCFKVFIPVLVGDTEAIERVAYELCEDQAAAGVLYFEARYAPHLLSDHCAADDHSHKISPRKVVQAVNRGLARGSNDFDIKAKSILCCMRSLPEWSHEVVQLCSDYKGHGVVGIDLAGDESLGEIPAEKRHIQAFKLAKERGIHRTVHAGEAGPAASVKEALDLLEAERIGHGYHVLEDKELYQRVIDEQVHLEVCPTSSILTGAVNPHFEKHPVRRFAEDGVNFSINSDDPLVCQTNLWSEYRLAFNKLELNTAALTKATFNAAKASFLPKKEKAQLINKLKEVYGVP